MLYPTISDWWNSLHQTYAVAGYVESVADHSAEENQKLREEAEAYNQRLYQSGEGLHNLTEEEEKEYNSLLNITEDGIMGYVDIPKIHVQLPIYHGTDEAVLEVAVGHIPGSSLPVGGPNTHTVVSGHRGLPSARLFTDIDQLREGDTFTLNVLDETLTYEVDQIRTVLPDELQDLTIQEGQDYCTLVTCTPYAVNTHRLLVHARRTEYKEEMTGIVAEHTISESDRILLTALGIVVVILALDIVVILKRHQRIRKAEKPNKR